MTNKDNSRPIPAQRYFTLEQLCAVLDISVPQFQAWQRENGWLGYGGQHYTRRDVLQLCQLKNTFAPYVDAFTHNFVDEQGEPAMDALALKQALAGLLDTIDQVLELSAIAEQAS